MFTNEIFSRYCGHGSGTKHLPGEKIQQLRVVALPLLFGCSSVTREHLGGRVEYTGVSDKYMIAGRWASLLLLSFIVMVINL